MAALYSFYLSSEYWTAPYELSGGEAHHLSRVLRIKQGERVRLFDGEGRHGIFSVHSLTKQTVSLIPETEFFTRRPVGRCTLAAGFSKALRRSWFLEKAVELEADALWFWQGDHSQARLPEEEKSAWKTSMIAGAKQCENPWLPDLRMIPEGVQTLAEAVPFFDRAFMLYEGDTQGRLLAKDDLAGNRSLLLIVGPEGGFSAREAELLARAALPVSLGNRVLRWETAALLTLGMAWWARQG
jgi:16S rRNA (uracil1498-N3)-methyltransferase